MNRWFMILMPAIICIAALTLLIIAVQGQQYWHAAWMVATAILAGGLTIKGIVE